MCPMANGRPVNIVKYTPFVSAVAQSTNNIHSREHIYINTFRTHVVIYMFVLLWLPFFIFFIFIVSGLWAIEQQHKEQRVRCCG